MYGIRNRGPRTKTHASQERTLYPKRPILTKSSTIGPESRRPPALGCLAPFCLSGAAKRPVRRRERGGVPRSGLPVISILSTRPGPSSLFDKSEGPRPPLRPLLAPLLDRFPPGAVTTWSVEPRSLRGWRESESLFRPAPRAGGMQVRKGHELFLRFLLE